MENGSNDGVSEPSPGWTSTPAPDDASELDDLAAEMEWERWRSRPGVPWRLVAWLAAALAVAIASLVLLIVLGHAGWTDSPR